MPISECLNCGGRYEWRWEEAFEKYGFQDGNGQVETWQVKSVLVEAGYEVAVEDWGRHNTVIVAIKGDGCELLAENFSYERDNPRDCLPQHIVDLLDRELP